MIKCSRGHDEVQPWEGMSNEVYGNLRDKTASTMATEKIAVNFIPSCNYIYIYIYNIYIYIYIVVLNINNTSIDKIRYQ